jgi:hypothetical protein
VPPPASFDASFEGFDRALPQLGDERSALIVLSVTALIHPERGFCDCGQGVANMYRMLMRSFALAGCLLALATAVTASAMADDGTAGDDAQLLDVSKQVSGIEKKMNELLAHGRWARAGELLESADCGYGEAAPVFAPWGDSALYTLAPQGDLSASNGWTLSKQATVVPSPDPFSGAHQSLQFGKGAEAATPAMCVNLDNPTIRFFVRDLGGNGKSQLKVDVLYEDFSGHIKHLTIAKLRAGTEWQPSVILPMYMNMLALASPSGLTAVAFRFKAEGLQKDETLSISSLLVDPFSSR